MSDQSSCNCGPNLKIGDKSPNVVNLFIEISRGQKNKYEFDKDSGVLMLDRVNGVSMGYPTDYGFVPETLCLDGDPLDGLLVIDESVPNSVSVPVRAVGVLYFVDDKEPDEKVIFVANDDVTKSHINEVEDLGPNFKPMIEHYLSQYKSWKNDWKGTDVKFNGWGNKEAALKVISESAERYNSK